MFYNIAISEAPINLSFTYSSELDLELGERVVVDLHGNKVKGYVLEKVESSTRKVKPVLERIDGFSFLSVKDVELVKWISHHFFSPIGKVFDLFLPSYIDKYLETYLEPSTELIGFKKMKVTEFLKGRSEEELKLLLKKGYARIVKSRDAFKIPRIPKEKTYVTLIGDIHDILMKVKSEMEYEIVNYLLLARSIKTEELIETLGVGTKELEKMAERGILKFSELAFPIKNRGMHSAEAFSCQNPGGCIITGQDDMTRLFMISQQLREVLDRGYSVLYLTPYSSQAIKLAGVASTILERKVVIFHSRLTNARKALAWLTAYSGTPAIFFATRAGVFLPLKNLGLVVIESEEEEVYYQPIEPVYDAVEAAQKKASLYQVPVIVLSSSCRLKTFLQVGKSSQFDISKPNLNVFVESIKERKQLLTPKLIELLGESLNKKQGAILIAKRKDYAPYVFCFACNFLIKCPNCSVPLSYSESQKSLRCHQCGWKEPIRRICPNCGAPALYPVGIGGERVEKILRYHIPEAHIRFASVEEAEPKMLLDMLIKFELGEIDVLVINQPIVHILGLSRIGLVAILDFDGFLNQPDYSSRERTIQLVRKITQVNEKAKVIIQTRNVHPESIMSLVNSSLEELYEAELIRRREGRYPPYYNLIQVILECENMDIGWEMIQDLAAKIKSAEVLGPVEHPIFKVSGKYRYHFILKTDRLDEILHEFEKEFRSVDTRGLKIFVNPPKLL